MRALSIFLIFIVISAPAYAFSINDVFKPIENFINQLNKLFYNSDIVGEIDLFRANYDIINGVYVEKNSWKIISGLNVTGLDDLAKQQEIGVIIQFKLLPDDETIYKIAEMLGGEVYHIDRGINAVSIRFADKPKLKAWIETNASLFDVASVYVDYAAKVPEGEDFEDVLPVQQSSQEISTKQIRNAAWNQKMIVAPEVWKENITGSGVVIAILDTGVDDTHPMLNGSIIGSISMVEGEDPKDYNGHGTHCAGIAAGRPVYANGIWVSGTAPGAKILNVKVLGKNGGGSLSTVIKGLDYVAQWKDRHPDTPVVVSMSLGTPFGNPSDPVSQKVNWLVEKKHIPVVVAAGNEFVVIDSPGLADGAITVAAVDSKGRVASFSGKGPGTNWKDIKPDIAAPGVKIASAKANSESIVVMSGTSMATPHVAGVVALVLQANPKLGPEKIKALLQETAVDRPEVPEIWEGAGIVDASRAVEEAPLATLPARTGILAKIFNLEW